MKMPVKIDALSTRHSFIGENPEYFLEVRLLGHRLEVPVTDDLVKSLDAYIAEATRRRSSSVSETRYEERREFPSTYDSGVDYDIGEVSTSDMEDL